MSDRLVSDVVDGLLSGHAPADLSADEIGSLLDVASEFQPVHRAAAIQEALATGSDVSLEALHHLLDSREPWSIDDGALEIGSEPTSVLDFETPRLRTMEEVAIDPVDHQTPLDLGDGFDFGAGDEPRGFDVIDTETHSIHLSEPDIDYDAGLAMVDAGPEHPDLHELDQEDRSDVTHEHPFGDFDHDDPDPGDGDHDVV